VSAHLTFVTWRWEQKNYRSKFSPKTVTVLRNMIARHYQMPHRFLCVAEKPNEIDRDIETVKDFGDFVHLKSPYGDHQPSCYRRLRAFHPDIGKVFGPRFVSMDLDTVIVGDIAPLFERPEDFVVWGETDPRSLYNGSMFLLTAGSRPQVWQQFNPKVTPGKAKAAGRFGSDQGTVSYILGEGEAMWGTQDGVYSYRIHIQPNGDQLPADARVIHCHGGQDPWGRQMQRLAWVQEHYQ
jgi:hypothetical protein